MNKELKNAQSNLGKMKNSYTPTFIKKPKQSYLNHQKPRSSTFFNEYINELMMLLKKTTKKLLHFFLKRVFWINIFKKLTK